jgi:hypothetical protein
MKEELQPFTREQFNEYRARAEAGGYKVITRWRPGIKGIRLGGIVLGSRKKCKCNDPDPLFCHECEESTGVCYCKCHESYQREKSKACKVSS